MLASANWVNAYLDPPATAEEQAELLTRAGFPLEASEPLSGSDVRQDFEMTSNRGDCVCHVGLAREIAAISGRTLKAPAPKAEAAGRPAADVVSVTNREPALCPLYTARIIRGVTVGPSPAWLQERLKSIGQIPRNNIVDASNFVLFELGQPTHCFDLAKLGGPEIVVRTAKPGESFLPIGEGAEAVELTGGDLVIADAGTAVAIAGVKGGALTAVTATTTDLLVEAATFSPAAVRNTSRRHGIESDSSYRFERGVHPAQVDAAAERLVALVLEIAGGALCEGVVADGAPVPAPREVTMRPDRCRLLLGMPVEDARMLEWLDALGFAPRPQGEVIRCTVPVHRLDVEREVDLIEEVGRMMGHDRLPLSETLRIRAAPLQPAVMAQRAVYDALVGMGFVETVTHSLVDARDAEAFLPPGGELLELETQHGGHGQSGGVLRPSPLPSLLRVLAHNHDNGVDTLALFEEAATFMRRGGGHEEHRRLGLVADVVRNDDGLRPLRGAVERLVELLCGPDAETEVVPDDGAAWLSPGALVTAGGTSIGRIGLVATKVAREFGLDAPVAAAELELGPLAEAYPPEREAHALPQLPAVERDVSAIVGEQVAWASIETLVEGLSLEHLEAVEFVTAFRGKPIPRGRKSVTLRLRFRAPDRTLKHESVDASVEKVVAALDKKLGAEIRR